MASDEKRLQWVRRQPCSVCGCPGPNHAHHSTAGHSGVEGPKALGGRRGKGQKASDTEVLPLCIKDHANLHALRGFFSGYTKNELRAWQDNQVRLHQSRYDEHLALQGEPLPTRDEAGKELGVDILAGGSTDPRELAATLASVHQLSPQAEHDVERVIRHVARGARA